MMKAGRETASGEFALIPCQSLQRLQFFHPLIENGFDDGGNGQSFLSGNFLEGIF